jgi:hypothetical protein
VADVRGVRPLHLVGPDDDDPAAEFAGAELIAPVRPADLEAGRMRELLQERLHEGGHVLEVAPLLGADPDPAADEAPLEVGPRGDRVVVRDGREHEAALAQLLPVLLGVVLFDARERSLEPRLLHRDRVLG